MEVVEAGLQRFLVECPLIVLFRLVNKHVHFVLKQVVPDGAFCGVVSEIVVLQLSFNCIFDLEHCQYSSIGRGLIEICIINAIAGVSQRNSSGISTKFLNGLAQGQEIASGLAHLLPIEHQVPI